MPSLDDYKPVYKELAEHYSNAYGEASAANIHLRNGFEVILNLTTNTTPTATDITLYLLQPLYKAWRQAMEFWQLNVHMRQATKKINDYVVRKCQEDLTDFVNSVSWDGGCIPDGQIQLSEDAGFDTTDWNTCS